MGYGVLLHGLRTHVRRRVWFRSDRQLAFVRRSAQIFPGQCFDLPAQNTRRHGQCVPCHRGVHSNVSGYGDLFGKSRPNRANLPVFPDTWLAADSHRSTGQRLDDGRDSCEQVSDSLQECVIGLLSPSVRILLGLLSPSLRLLLGLPLDIQIVLPRWFPLSEMTNSSVNCLLLIYTQCVRPTLFQGAYIL